MRTLQKLFFAVTVVAAGGLVALGCGGDDTNDVPKADGGPGRPDSSVNPMPDGSDTTDGPPDLPPDGGDTDGPITPPRDGGPDADGGDAGPRDFAAYVVDLIKTKTNETTPPTSDLCDQCTDKRDQMDFKVLFP